MRYLLFFLILLVSCAGPERAKAPLVLKEASFDDLPGWGKDDFKGFSQAFQRSCDQIRKRGDSQDLGALKEAGTVQRWRHICLDFETLDSPSANTLRVFFENRFTPYQVLAGREDEGLFTGYYEAELKGSCTRSERYNIPLYARPDDLVMVHLGQFREELKGIRIAGRVQSGTLKPYEERAEIVAGDWPHNDKALVWVDDAVDAFFVQIQGSGVVELEGGGEMRIGYAGQNGHPYYAIGRDLVARKALDKDEVSLQSIRAWLAANPAQADTVMNTNKSYVFFRELSGEGPIGGQGVALTAGRSLAVDRTLMSYGVPLWVDIEPPMEGEQRLRRLMVAQDTGGAIQGPVRGDFFWGHGPKAEEMAGMMKSEGRYWAFLPR